MMLYPRKPRAPKIQASCLKLKGAQEVIKRKDTLKDKNSLGKSQGSRQTNSSGDEVDWKSSKLGGNSKMLQ